MSAITPLRIEVAWFANGGEEGRPAFAEGLRLGMSRAEVIEVAIWCAAQIPDREAA
jgi:hypothetical protein